MARDRRAFLFGCNAVMTAFAGCQTLSSGEQSQLDLALGNYTTREQQLRITILPEGGGDPEEPVIDDREYTVPAPGSDSDAAGTVREADIAPEGRYFVRVQLRNGRFERFHTHYRPSASSGGEIFIGIRRDDGSGNLFVDFRSV